MASTDLPRVLDEAGVQYELLPHGRIGGGRRDPVVVDIRLVGRESRVFEAGSHEESIRIAPADVVRTAGAQTADIRAD